MTVGELAKLLSICNPEDIVVYDARTAIENGWQLEDGFLGVHDMYWSSGTVQGFVFLKEDEK